MLNKSIAIGLNKFKLTNLSSGILLRELVENLICYTIKYNILSYNLQDIHVTYNYDIYKLQSFNMQTIFPDYKFLDRSELSTITHLLDKFIEQTINEFYVKHRDKLLNFNFTVLNGNNILVIAECLEVD